MMKLRLGVRWLLVSAGLCLAGGCGEVRHEAAPEAHRHESAHGGVAVELGDHAYHLDFLADPTDGTLEAWVMDGHLESFVRVPLAAIEIQVTVVGTNRLLRMEARANPATGETAGHTSHFKGSAGWLRGISGFTAMIPVIEIRGESFTNIPFEYQLSP
jgi:hypothetical protein